MLGETGRGREAISQADRTETNRQEALGILSGILNQWPEDSDKIYNAIAILTSEDKDDYDRALSILIQMYNSGHEFSDDIRRAIDLLK